MNKLLNKIDFYIIALIIIAFVTHIEWFNFGSVLFSWDWKIWPDDIVKSLVAGGQGTYISYFDFGAQNVQVYFNALFILWGLAGSYIVASKVLVLIPVAIFSLLSPYLLIKYLINSKRAAFIGALSFAFSTTLLYKELSHLFLALSFSLQPLVLLFFIKFLKKQSSFNLIKFVVVFNIVAVLEIRMVFVSFLILGIYALYSLEEMMYFFKKKYIALFFVIIISFLLNVFWIAPTFLFETSAISDIADRGIFGDHLANLFYSITNSYYSWTGHLATSFITQPIKIHSWVVVFIAFSVLSLNLSLLSNKSKNTHKYILYFATISLLGIFLCKQSAEPFVSAYSWLYYNFPGFNLFRESSKFFVLIGLGYAFLISGAYYFLVDSNQKINNIIKNIIFIILSLVLLINAIPLVNKEIGHLFFKKQEPADYALINNKIESDKDFYRTMWVPRDSRWGRFSNKNPKIGLASILKKELIDFSIVTNSSKVSVENNLLTLLKFQYFNSIIDSGSIKYVIVPNQDSVNDYDDFEYYGGSENENIRQWYIDQLDKLLYLKRSDIKTKDLVIYENKNYKPYFRTTSSILSYDSLQNINLKYLFSSNTLGREFDFVVPNTKDLKKFPKQDISLLFENLNINKIKNGKISEVAKSTGKNSAIYIDTGKREIEYVNDEGRLMFFANNRKNLSQNSDRVASESNLSQIFSMPIDSDKQYYIGIGTRIISLNPTNDNKSLDVQTESFNLFSSDLSKDAIYDGFFARGAWQNEVEDCNAYDEEGILDMTIAQDGRKEGNVLELSAINHIACTGPGNRRINGGEKYLFSFDYQSPNGQVAGYHISFDDVNNTAVSEKLPVENNQWHHYQKVIDVPDGVTNFSLFVYSYSMDDETNIVTRYSNFQMTPLKQVAIIDPQYRQNFKKVNLPIQDSYSFEYKDSSYDFVNLIRKASFENGLWNNKVGDCHNYDGNGKLGVVLSDIASDGKKSLELQATRHIACTGPGVLPVLENEKYLLSFDYQSSNGKYAGYYFGFNDPDHTVISEKLSIKDQNWQTLNKEIKVPAGASSVSLVVYSYANDEKVNIITRYDNFHFVKLPDLEDRYYVVSEPEANFVDPKEINFDLLNPTKKLVHIKSATTPFYLAMSEGYHSQWQAQMNNKKINGFFANWVPFVKPDRIEDDKHFELNGFLNGWFIEPEEVCKNKNTACVENIDGSYDIEMIIEFSPQRWFHFGLLISGITLIGCLGYLGYDFAKRRKNKKFKKQISHIQR